MLPERGISTQKWPEIREKGQRGSPKIVSRIYFRLSWNCFLVSQIVSLFPKMFPCFQKLLWAQWKWVLEILIVFRFPETVSRFPRVISQNISRFPEIVSRFNENVSCFFSENHEKNSGKRETISGNREIFLGIRKFIWETGNYVR